MAPPALNLQPRDKSRALNTNLGFLIHVVKDPSSFPAGSTAQTDPDTGAKNTEGLSRIFNEPQGYPRAKRDQKVLRFPTCTKFNLTSPQIINPILSI